MNTDEFNSFAEYLFGLLERFEISLSRDCSLTLFRDAGCLSLYSLCGDVSYISRLPYHEAMFSAYPMDTYSISYLPLNTEYLNFSNKRFMLPSERESSNSNTVRTFSEKFSSDLMSAAGEHFSSAAHALYCDQNVVLVSSDNAESLIDTIFKIEEYIKIVSEKRRRIEKVIDAAGEAVTEILSRHSKYECNLDGIYSTR